jgi:hypothetical protein
MTPEENRSFDNLILLCKFHHGEVDRKDLEHLYPEETLKQWKIAQVSEGASRGPELTDEEAQQIVATFVDSSTVVQATHLTVGGTGGSAPGASGGGGGAIGAGAVGGMGGPIGRIDLDGTPGRAPGAGGGGGGVISDDSITLTSHELQAGSIGVGGVHGMDGQPGGASSFGDLLFLPGGIGGLSGNSDRVTSPLLKVSTLLVGGYFHVRDGVIFAVAGGWRAKRAQSATSTTAGCFGSFEAAQVPAGDYTMHISVHDPSGERRGRVSFPLTVDSPGGRRSHPLPRKRSRRVH